MLQVRAVSDEVAAPKPAGVSETHKLFPRLALSLLSLLVLFEPPKCFVC
jgi:hypothetical protein